MRRQQTATDQDHIKRLVKSPIHFTQVRFEFGPHFLLACLIFSPSFLLPSQELGPSFLLP